jgi:hypothetical protein
MFTRSKVSIRTAFGITDSYVQGIVVSPSPDSDCKSNGENTQTKAFKTNGTPREYPMNDKSDQLKIEVYGVNKLNTGIKNQKKNANRIGHPLNLDKFNLTLNSTDSFEYNIKKETSKWIISRKKQDILFQQTPYFVSRLPKKLDKWYVRSALLLVEVALKVLRFPVELVILAVTVFTHNNNFKNGENPEDTGVTVGSEEE